MHQVFSLALRFFLTISPNLFFMSPRLSLFGPSTNNDCGSISEVFPKTPTRMFIMTKPGIEPTSNMFSNQIKTLDPLMLTSCLCSSCILDVYIVFENPVVNKFIRFRCWYSRSSQKKGRVVTNLRFEP